jgi:uncharacterized protein YjbI with pentapeptide repeats
MSLSSEPRLRLNIAGAVVRRTDWTLADLEQANLAGTDAAYARFRGANLKDAVLTGTILRGADLRDARNLTVEQLAAAVIDDATRLPAYIDRAKPAAAG